MKLLDRMQTMLWHQHKQCHISLGTETYTEGGGGFLDDVDVQFLSLKFRTSEGTPYDKAGRKIVPLLQVDLLPEGTEDVRSQFYSCGDMANWAPSPDGETLVAQSAKAKESGGIGKSCNAAMFLLSLVQAGVPNAKLSSEKISDLVGIKAHMVLTKRPKDNIKRDEGAKEPQVLTVSKLISVPWENGATAPQTVAAVAAAPAKREPATLNNGVFDDEALGTLARQILAENSGTMKKMALMQEVYKAATAGAIPEVAKDPEGKPARTTVPQRMLSDAFLQSQSFWGYDKTTVTLQ